MVCHIDDRVHSPLQDKLRCRKAAVDGGNGHAGATVMISHACHTRMPYTSRTEHDSSVAAACAAAACGHMQACCCTWLHPGPTPGGLCRRIGVHVGHVHPPGGTFLVHVWLHHHMQPLHLYPRHEQQTQQQGSGTAHGHVGRLLGPGTQTPFALHACNSRAAERVLASHA
jgi:hypothetical protein